MSKAQKLLLPITEKHFLCMCAHVCVFTSTNLDKSYYYNENQREKFSYSENVLDPCRPTHTGAVHPGQEYCTYTHKHTQQKNH